MAELTLDVDRTLALLEQERGERVAQAMRREMRREFGPLSHIRSNYVPYRRKLCRTYGMTGTVMLFTS